MMRIFWPASVVLWVFLVALVAWCVGTPARGQERVEIISPPHEMGGRIPTVVELRPTTEPGAVAEVHIRNESVNDSTDNGTYPMIGHGVVADLIFTWNRWGSEDDFEVIADGLIAVPPVLSVPEESSGVIVLYPDRSVGY